MPSELFYLPSCLGSLKLSYWGSWVIVPSEMFELSKTELPGLIGYKAFLSSEALQNELLCS